MAIPLANLQLITGNVSSVVRPSGSVVLNMTWRAYHLQTDTTIESGIETRIAASPGGVDDVTADLRVRCEAAYSAALAKHEARSALDGLSLQDADLVMDRWMFGATGAIHPICGTHAITPDLGSYVEMVTAILGVCLPPPVWAWAESVEAGKLRVKCIAVPAASGYEVYNGDELLGSPADLTDWVESVVPAGIYVVRCAGAAGGQTGTLSFPMTVEVM